MYAKNREPVIAEAPQRLAVRLNSRLTPNIVTCVNVTPYPPQRPSRRTRRRKSATRHCWSKGIGGCDDSMKLRLSSSGCETRPAKGSPPEPVASLATVAATRPAKRRHASVWAVGFAASKTMSSRMPRVLFHLKATTTSPSRWARRGSYPAGCSTTARRKRTAQEPGRPSLLLENNR